MKKEILFALCLSLFCALTGCTFFNETDVCPYNLRLEYWYAGNSAQNVLPLYAENLRQYLFDAEGKLFSVETLRGDSIEGWNGELPAGDYTVVVWGNIDDTSEKQLPTEGAQSLGELTLSAVQAGVPPGYRGNTSRLYYGSASFTVEEGKVTRQRIYLSHAHAVLSVTVRWMDEELMPPAGGTYRMQLRNVPAVYGFVKGWETAMPTGDGVYAVPRIGSTQTHHETRADMSYDNEVEGTFVTFRYTGSTHPMWSLRRNGELIEKELDLYKFFSTLPMNMDRNVEQEFDILISIYADRIIVALDVYVFGSATEDGTYTFQERFAYREDPTVNPLPTGATLLEVTAGGTDNNQLTTTLHLQKGLFVKIYCVANQTDLVGADGAAVTDAGYTPLTLTTPGETGTTVGVAGTPTLTDFLAYHSPLLKADNFRDVLQTPLPMTGAVTTPIDLTDFSVTTRLQTGFKLTRTVARFDVINEATTSKLTIKSISMGNARSGVNLFPITAYEDATNDLITYPERSFSDQTDANAGTAVGAFYSYPSPKADNGYLILKGTYQINQTDYEYVTYQVPFKSAGNSSSTLEINPNHRYTLAITAADEYHIDFNLTVADWADDGSIDGYRPEEPFVKVATVTGADETFGDDIQVAATTDTKTLTLDINSNQKLETPVVTYEATYGGDNWLTATLKPATKATGDADYTYEIEVAKNEDADAANQVHIGYVTLKWGEKENEKKTFTIYRGASRITYLDPSTSQTVRMPAVKMKDGSYWAPVNVGATKISDGTEEEGSDNTPSLGKLFQWGRKYGFPASSVATIEKNLGDKGYPYQDNITDNTMGQWDGIFIPNSTTSPNSKYNWLLINGKDTDNPDSGGYKENGWYQQLWNSGTSTSPQKTVFDPCPAGWRVPTLSEAKNIVSDEQPQQRLLTIKGADGQSLILPQSGEINDSGTYNFTSTLNYWTASINMSGAYVLSISRGAISFGYTSRIYGKPIRCIQNTGAEPNSSVE